MSKVLYLFQTQTEVDKFLRTENYNSETCLALCMKYPAFTLPKKVRPDNASQGDFVLRSEYKKKLNELFHDNDISNVITYAMHDMEGLIWSSHWMKLFFQPLPGTEAAYTPCDVVCRTYSTTYAFDNMNQYDDNIRPEFLLALFKFNVFSSIIASQFYRSVSKHAAKKLLGSTSSALSLGMLRCLSFFCSIENKRVWHATLMNDKSGNASQYHFSRYDNVPVNSEPSQKAPAFICTDAVETSSLVLQTTDTGLFQVEDPVTLHVCDQVLGVPTTHLVEIYDPYVTCLLNNIHVRSYNHMVRSGILSVPMNKTYDIAYHTRNKATPNVSGTHAELHSFMSQLANQGVLANKVVDDLRSYLAHDHPRYKPQRVCSVLGTVTDEVAASTDYAILYDYYLTETLLSFCSIPLTSHYAVYASLKLNGYHYQLNKRNAIPCFDPHTVTMNGWTGLIDSSRTMLQTLNTETTEFHDHHNAVVGDDPTIISHVMNMLESCFGYSPEYTSQMIRSLSRRGYLSLSSTGCRVTCYGYAVYKSHEALLKDKTMSLFDKTFFDMFLDTVHNSFDPKHSTVTEMPDRDESWLDTYLQGARSVLDELEKNVKRGKVYSVTVKSKKTGKKTKYKLVLDRKKKLAWFESRKKAAFCFAKPVPVKYAGTDDHKKVQAIDLTYGISLEPTKLVTTKLAPGKANYIKHSEVIEAPCPVCNGIRYKYKLVENNQVNLECLDCKRDETPAVFRIDVNQPSNLFD